MKTSKITKIFLVCSLIIGLSACADSYLDTQPSSSIGEASATSTLNNLDLILNGIHSFNYQDYQTNGYTGEQSLHIVRDMLGEDVINSTTGNGWYISETRWLGHRNERSWLAFVPWNLYYKIILNANGILSKIDNPDLKGDQSQKDRIKAEALTLRAWAHFELVQLYGKRYDATVQNTQLGVVIRDEVSTSEKPRATVEETYKFINDDLDKAITLFKSSSLNVKYRVTATTANGIKARVALVQQHWADAAKYANDAITLAGTNGIKLQSGIGLLTGFNSLSGNSEWMWAYTQTTDQNLGYAHFLAYMSWNFNSSNIRTNPKIINKDLYEKMSATDVRRNWWDPTGKKWKVGIKEYASYASKPYENHKFESVAQSNSSGDILLMRIGEMYYIAAEAYARDSKTAEAQEILRKIMVTRDPSYVLSINTGEALIDEILTNRRVDLWGEGFRFLDLKRLNQNLDRKKATNTPPSVSVIMQVPAGDKQWQFLITQDEINSNPNVIQNEL